MKNFLHTTLLTFTLVVASVSLVACKKAETDTNTSSEPKAVSEPSTASQTTASTVTPVKNK